MSYIESPLETVQKFIPSWRSSHPKRLAEEIKSVFNETNRHPDSFKLIFRKGKILNFETEEPVNIDRSSYIGQKEGEFFDAFSKWLSQNSEGAAIWISPLFSDVYPSNKITIYQIINTGSEEKITFNTSIILDTSAEHALEIASSINPVFIGCPNPEVLRNKLFAVNENFDLLDLLKLTSIKLNSRQTPGQETIEEFVELIHLGYDPRLIAQKMQQRGIIGEHAVSCASLNLSTNPTFGAFMDKNSFLMKFVGGESGKYVKNCGHCGIRIESKISKGYRCLKCGGVYEGC